MNFQTDDSFVECGGEICQQVIGIPICIVKVFLCLLTCYSTHNAQRTRTDFLSAPRKIRVMVRFFIRLSQRTRTDFLWPTKNLTYLTIFHWCDLAHTAQFFIGVIVLENWHCLIKSLRFFYWTEVSAHGPIFNRRQIVDGNLGLIYFWTKKSDKKSVRVRWA